ncbi:MAG: hypothetical protein IT243_08725 [Bacteroidia bacterium]|nr:hypothetical protein [Bacteroidia bacterium]
MYYQSVTIGADMGGNFFKSASNKLIPGNTYLIKFYPIRKRVTTQECIDFMLNQGAILTNAQGLTLAWSNNGNKFPSDGWILSLDYRDSLSRQPNVGYKELRVPMIGNDDVKEFGTYSENSAWDTGFAYLLGYFEKRDFTR